MADSRGNPVSSLKDEVTTGPAAERLKQEATAFAAAQAQRLLVSAGRKLGGATARLNDVAEGNSPGLVKLATQGGKKFAEGKGPLRSAVEIGASGLKDKAREAFQGLGGGGRKGGGGQGRFVTVVEDIDVGVPLREAYDQWTQYQEFSTFTKGVQGVETSDDTSSNWRAKVLWSNRSWKANTTEQIPDERIAWTSEGAKGTTKGVVTFHALGDNLTRILLVVEYHPKGLFEKTGNIWRAQGRRARLDLKHFRRFLMMRGEATGSWRGEIRDGEVVLGHEEALEEEREQSAAGSGGTGREDRAGGAEEELPDDGYEDEGEPGEDPADREEAGAEEPEDAYEDAYEEDDAEETAEEPSAEDELEEDGYAEDRDAEEAEPARESGDEAGDEAEYEASDRTHEPEDEPGDGTEGAAAAEPEEYEDEDEEYAEEEPERVRASR
ncbi:SRPBCC family protein [Streptomyces lycii]|uniref:Cyclase n=1 Tax=Streptomyces lycii TaxID=2654337 RepID=A0ABQ7FEZ7_9ACTN|nr:SRPBCC family protein [Streptomyces lycii]KAF4407177.1 cyclase [Streptomyces lycii]